MIYDIHRYTIWYSNNLRAFGLKPSFSCTHQLKTKQSRKQDKIKEPLGGLKEPYENLSWQDKLVLLFYHDKWQSFHIQESRDLLGNARDFVIGETLLQSRFIIVNKDHASVLRFWKFYMPLANRKKLRQKWFVYFCSIFPIKRSFETILSLDTSKVARHDHGYLLFKTILWTITVC